MFNKDIKTPLDYTKFSYNTGLFKMDKPSCNLVNCINSSCKIWFNDEPCECHLGIMDYKLC